MDDDAYYCLPYFEPHALLRDYMLAHPDANMEWYTTAAGASDAFLDEQTERGFRRWHHAMQAAAICPARGALWWAAAGLERWGAPPV